MADLNKVEHFVTGQPGHADKLNTLVDLANGLLDEVAELRAELAKKQDKRAPKTAATEK